jgi:hypothetical protein
MDGTSPMPKTGATHTFGLHCCWITIVEYTGGNRSSCGCLWPPPAGPSPRDWTTR